MQGNGGEKINDPLNSNNSRLPLPLGRFIRPSQGDDQTPSLPIWVLGSNKHRFILAVQDVGRVLEEVDEEMTDTIRTLTAQIVTAYVTSHSVSVDALPSLVQSVHDALARAGHPVEPEPEKPIPAVNPRKSVFPDYIICLEDGKKLKTLKRHLKSTYGMTPQEYREKWGLPPEYPMVAPEYAARRSEIAKKLGLGRRK